MKILLPAILTLGFSLAFPAFAAEPRVLRSGPRQVALVELFTSEGCSSCPPAEKWLAGLATAPGLWRDFVPLAFHVDYWDGLGWPDRFASPENTRRQESYAAHWRSRSVYTPGVVKNGVEWRGWGGSPDFSESLKSLAGLLEVSAGAETNRFTVTFAPPPGMQGELVATVAWLGSNLVSDVRRGENAGRKLGHSFVVLRLAKGTLANREGAATVTLELPAPEKRDAEKLALAAWVSRRGEPGPVQAVGGWWPN